MAEEDRKYVKQIYINGEPYIVRDEECRTSVEQLKLAYNEFSKSLSNFKTIIDENFDNLKFTSTVDWNTDYENKVRNSKIPYIKQVENENGYSCITIGYK